MGDFGRNFIIVEGKMKLCFPFQNWKRNKMKTKTHFQMEHALNFSGTSLIPQVQMCATSCFVILFEKYILFLAEDSK